MPQLQVAITVDDRPTASHTRLTELGGYHVAISSVLLDPALALEVHSSYLGHPSAMTCATHLTIAPGAASTRVIEHDREQLPVTHARERCALDHLQVLVALAAEHGHIVAVQLPDRALV